MAFLMGFLIGAFGVSLIVIGNRKNHLADELSTHGIPIRALVVSHDDYGGKDPCLTVNFVVDGSTIVKTFSVPSSVYFSTQDGASERVVYLKEDPTQAQIVGNPPKQSAGSFIGAGIGLIGLGALLMFGVSIWAAKSPAEDL